MTLTRYAPIKNWKCSIKKYGIKKCGKRSAAIRNVIFRDIVKNAIILRDDIRNVVNVV